MRAVHCERCQCIDGKFHCRYDEMQCGRHRRSLTDKDSAGDDNDSNTSSSAAQNIHALSNIGSAVIAVTVAVLTLH